MAKPLLSDDLWREQGRELPPRPPKPTGCRPGVPDRAALTGIPWELLPRELGCGSGMTRWRRLRDWHAAGIWRRMHRRLLDRLGRRGGIDWSRASLDSRSLPAKRGASIPARTRPSAASPAASTT